jgi:hypothetical protein
MELSKIPYNLFPSIDYALNASAGGRVSVPVSPSSYIYSHFRHISGTPAPEGVEGVSVSKLKILDSLIEEIVRLRAMPEPSYGAQGESPEERFSSMVEQFQEQVRKAQAANTATPYQAASPEQGMIFNVAA